MIEKKFKLKDNGQALNDLFMNINNEEYIWHIEVDDVLAIGKDYDFIFGDEEILENKEFWNAIDNNKYLVVSVTLKLYKNKKAFENKDYSLSLQIDDTIFGIISVFDKEIEKIIERNINKIEKN